MNLDELAAAEAAKLWGLNLAWDAPVCTQAISKINFFDLKSLSAEKFILNYFADPLSLRQAFLTNLTVTLVTKIDKEGSAKEYNATSPTKEMLKKGWSDWKTVFNTTGNLPLAKNTLNSWYAFLRGNTAEEVRNNGEKLKKGLQEAMIDYQNADKALLAQLKSKDFKNSMTQFFVEGIWNKAAAMLATIGNFIDEQALCVNRYDAIYQTADLEKVLLLNPYTRFYPSEIKAVNMQETADYTDIGIAGLSATGIGMPKTGLKQGEYVGIAQLGATTSVGGAKAMIEMLYNSKQIDANTQAKWRKYSPTINMPPHALLHAHWYSLQLLLDCFVECGQSVRHTVQ